MSAATETSGGGLNHKRAAFWEAESRKRKLADWELDELYRANREIKNDQRRAAVRAQAAPPAPRSKRK